MDFHIFPCSEIVFSRVLFVILLALLCSPIKAEECDFLKCVYSVNCQLSKLKNDPESSQCETLLRNSFCSGYCMKKYYPEIQLSKQKDFPDLNSFFDNLKDLEANWSCIISHAFRLMTCFANVSSMSYNELQDATLSIQSCRRSVEYLRCPKDILLDECGKPSVETVSYILRTMTNFFIPHSCASIHRKLIFSSPVQYKLQNGYAESAKCFDLGEKSLSDCFYVRLNNDKDLDSYICGDRAGLDSCFAFNLKDDCKKKSDVKTFLPSILSYSGVKCSQLPLQISQTGTQLYAKEFINKKAANNLKSQNDYLHGMAQTPLSSTDLHIDETRNEITEVSVSPSMIEAELSVKRQNTSNVVMAISLDTEQSDQGNLPVAHSNNSSVKNIETPHINVDVKHIHVSYGNCLYSDTAIFLIVISLLFVVGWRLGSNPLFQRHC